MPAAADSSIDAIEGRYARIYPLARGGRLALQFSSTIVIVGSGLLLVGLVIYLTIAATAGAQDASTLSAILAGGVEFLGGIAFGLPYWVVLNLVNRMWRPAGLLWTAGAALALVLTIRATPDTLDSVMAPPAAMALPMAVYLLLGCALIGLLAYWAWVLPITVVRGGLALLFASAEQRLIMRETPSGRGFLRSAVNALLGLPPLTDFARDSRVRYAKVIVLASLGGLVLASAAIGAMAVPQLLIHAYGEAAQYFADFAWPLVALPLGLLALLFVLATIGREFERAELRQLRFSLEELQKVDPRAPVLFLRAFKDDQVKLPRPKLPHLGRVLDFGRREANLDEMLLEEVTPYGPLVALGNPRDGFPPYGAARKYFHDKTWQQAVEELAQMSSIVILCVDATAGIWWEVEHLVLTRQLAKTLFLIHPSHRGAEANQALLRKLLSTLGLPDDWLEPAGAPANRTERQPVLAFFMGESGSPRVLRSSSFSQFAFMLAIRTYVRAKLGLPGWRS